MKLAPTVVQLLSVVLGDRKAGLPGYLPRVIDGVPHLRDCRIGQAVDGYHNAPCSPLCVRVREICSGALDALGAPAVPSEAVS